MTFLYLIAFYLSKDFFFIQWELLRITIHNNIDRKEWAEKLSEAIPPILILYIKAPIYDFLDLFLAGAGASISSFTFSTVSEAGSVPLGIL